MFKLITASAILLAFVIQTFSGQFIELNYYLNTAAFAKNCENKAKPKMHCNGKCQMMKKLQQEEKKDQQNPERKSENKSEVLSSKSFFCSLEHFSILIQNSYSTTDAATIVDRAFSIFHPPQIC